MKIIVLPILLDVTNKKKLDHPKREKQYKKYISHQIFGGHSYPMSLRDIEVFGRRFNKFEGYPSISINDYIYFSD